MKVYKLAANATTVRDIDRQTFETDTRKAEPWYQPGDDGKFRQFAVCPACDNPIQIIGLYKPLANTDRPYGKHTGKPVKGFVHYDAEAYEWCPYVAKRQSAGRSKKKRFGGLPRKILQILVEQFDRVIYVIEKDTGVRISPNLARKMLRTYMGEEGYLYTGATLRNIPWIFAYMSDAQSIFGQKIDGNEALKQSIVDRIPHARFDDSGKITRGEGYYQVMWSFIGHHVSIQDGELTETIRLHVWDGDRRTIHRQTICVRPQVFESLLSMPPEKARRNTVLLQIAAEVVGPQAATLGITWPIQPCSNHPAE